jgi:hypothetical protein
VTVVRARTVATGPTVARVPVARLVATVVPAPAVSVIVATGRTVGRVPAVRVPAAPGASLTGPAEEPAHTVTAVRVRAVRARLAVRVPAR